MSVDGPNVIVGFGQQVAVAAPKARNMKARGKREAQRNASPLVTTNNLNRALKVRNTNIDYFALSELHGHCARLPGATRLTLFGACPWLSYSAPSALSSDFVQGVASLRLCVKSSLGAKCLMQGFIIDIVPRSEEH